MKMYIVWVNYHTEGWRPQEFDTAKEVVDAIEAGDFGGSPIQITTPITLELNGK